MWLSKFGTRVFIIKLCRQKALVVRNHDSENVRNFGQREAQHRKYKRLKLGDGQAHGRPMTASVKKAGVDRA